jgi:rod shape determining protein RodA
LKWRDQIRWVLIGAAVLLRRFADGLQMGALGLCADVSRGHRLVSIAVLAIGVEIGGNKAWIRVGGMMVQPSQFAIMSGILILAVIFGELPRMLPVFRRPWLRIIAAGLFAGVPAVLVIKEDLGLRPRLGARCSLSMMLVGSIPLRYLITHAARGRQHGAAGLCLRAQALPAGAYQLDLVHGHQPVGQGGPANEGWVAKHLQIAVSTGGLEGKGPESKKVPEQASIHRTFFPHESINDFIFGVVAEEFGFRGSILLLSGMALLLLQGVFVAFCARDQLGRLIVVGVVAMFFVHTFQNAGMNLVMLPVIGLPMPFISYGGTFVVVTLFLMGMMQSVWVHRNISSVKKPRSVNGARDEEEE